VQLSDPSYVAESSVAIDLVARFAEIAIIFGAAARYSRATVGSSRDDADLDNSTLHTGAIRPHTSFVGSVFSMSSRTGHGSSQEFEMLPSFWFISCACAFRAGDEANIFSVGPSRLREALVPCLDGLALLESHEEYSLWWRRIYITNALALNISAHCSS
jgi:hypothetical protein